MSRARRSIPLCAVIVGLAGCSSSSHPAAGGTTSAMLTTTSTSLTTSTAPAAHRTRATHASTATSATATSHSASSMPAGSGGAGLAPAGAATGGAAAGGSINARVPATFALSPAGTLSPSQVSAPAFLAVAVRINSASGIAHLARIVTPHPVQLRIPPHGTGATMIAGLRAGTYPILIDGARRGALVIGGEPGP